MLQPTLNSSRATRSSFSAVLPDKWNTLQRKTCSPDLIRSLPILLALFLIALVATPASAQTGALPVPLNRVSVDDAFWSPKRQVWQTVTIVDCLDKFERDGAFRNFRKIIEGRGGTHEGEPWFDGLVLEVIRGASDFLISHPDAALQQRIDGYVDLICTAAKADPHCFLSTYTQLESPNQRWGRNGGDLRLQHDIYNAGCMFETAVHYYRATGKRNLLEVAVRLADHMANLFGPAPKMNVVPGHALPEEALIKLYGLLKQEADLAEQIAAGIDVEKLLALAEFMVQGRGHFQGRESLGEYAQDGVPVFEQQKISGHAVRATLLCVGLAAIATERPAEPYYEVAERLWRNMTERRMYLTGGVGAIKHDEKFGADFELPHDGYQEICAAVGAGFFHLNMHRASAQGRYIDEFERTLYNAALSGVSLRGNQYLYESPLTSSSHAERWDWHPCPCCPPMFLKLMGALPQHIYSESDDAIYVNLFIGSHATLHTAEGKIDVTQSTDYPFGENIQIRIDPEPELVAETTLKLRIPGWCSGVTLRLNGQPLASPTVNHGYAVVSRKWNAGDVITLNLPMPVTALTANPRVQAAAGQVAFQKGPIVFCFEDIDNSSQLDAAFVTNFNDVQVVDRPDLFDGVQTIVVPAHRRKPRNPDDKLYQPQKSSNTIDHVNLTAIPFFAHSNRAATARKVWLPTSLLMATEPTVPTIASRGNWTASFNGDGTVQAIFDQAETNGSDDETIPRFTWWDHRGTLEWIQCDFAEPAEISEVSVYWWDERRIHRHCRVPTQWRVLQSSGDEWIPIPEQSSGPTEIDQFNTIRFPTTTIDHLRIEVELQTDWSGGVLEATIR
ncbi:DUF1680 family protein [Rhodopirellula rubra]|uniref:DUF1680 family protein n=1 Tax=Aporhodopirellula rubra TaxID=980271 RepID=A0A7W5H6A5_9BACT|nr:beta-L-arabinofuranosidase domain-containing protein [Aporhodopirellula rubra]MBB3207098.1 DUF1680 family protein [Aporhodopirellula rubra]